MNGSRVDRARSGALIGFCALALMAGTPIVAIAQSDGPIRLTPPVGNPFSPVQERGAGNISPPDEVERVPLRPPGGDGTSVEVEPLAAPGSEPIGALEEGAGLGSDVWEGAAVGEVERLLRDLPPQVPERSLSVLLQRLLLTRAPLGSSSAESAAIDGLRVAALVGLGDVDGAMSLISAMRERGAAHELARAELDALLIERETERACEAARRAVEATFDPYAQRVVVFCQIVAGERDRASVGLDLVRESAEVDDPLFIRLAETLLGFGSLPGEPPERLSPLHLRMWEATGEAIPRGAWLASGPAIWRAVAASPDAPLAQRIEAAEAAAGAAALPSEALASLYRLVQAAAGERDLVAAQEPDEWTVRERALLFQNAAEAASQPERAAALQRLFESARARGGYEAVVLAAAPLVGELDPGARLTFFAAHAARAHLLLHDLPSANEWAALAQREREINPYAARDAIELEPLLVLAGSGEAGQWDEASFATWWQRRQDADPTKAPASAALLDDLLDALGEPAPSMAGMSDATAADRGAPPVATIRGGPRGETILQIVHYLAAEGGAEAYRQRVPEALRALRSIGLESEARRLAVEVAIGAGI